MASFDESTIKTYSGLSSETKPTAAAGTTVPNGSRFREIDTRKTYIYNIGNDRWYELDPGSVADIDNKSALVFDYQNHILLENILLELKKMNLHLSIITDNNIGEEDVY